MKGIIFPHLDRPKSVLMDKFYREITYLRLSVTDRCNLRCIYCMPVNGNEMMPNTEILSWEEIIRIINIFVELGIKKLRLTGGEPFIRKGFMKFLKTIIAIPGLEEVYITTNGIEVARNAAELKTIGISGINLSLDTLNKKRFYEIARRDSFDQVMETLQTILKYNIMLKINTVVKDGLNTDEIIPLALLAQFYPIDVRFIEEMPFKGKYCSTFINWEARQIKDTLTSYFPEMKQLSGSGSTAEVYSIPNFAGRIGIIGSYSRSFCASCNRIRITAAGHLKTCLYDERELPLKSLLCCSKNDNEIKSKIRKFVAQRFQDGFEAQLNRKDFILKSMAAIGG